MKGITNEIQNELKQNINDNLKCACNNKQFNTYMTQTDINNFRMSKDGNNIEKYVQQYISQHYKDKVINEKDVYSLLLNAAIVLESNMDIKEILGSAHGKNILTQVDATNYSPLSNALESGNEEILSLVKNYIDANKTKITKTQQINKEDHDNILTTLKFPQFRDLVPQTILDNYLEPLYSQDCLGVIKDLVAQLSG